MLRSSIGSLGATVPDRLADPQRRTRVRAGAVLDPVDWGGLLALVILSLSSGPAPPWRPNRNVRLPALSSDTRATTRPGGGDQPERDRERWEVFEELAPLACNLS